MNLVMPGAMEIFAMATGIASVWLARSIHSATWPVGIASVACYAYVFVGARLYADALLQVFFIAASVYGWVKWANVQAMPRAKPITRAPPAEALAYAFATVSATLATTFVLMRWTDSPAPVSDAFVFAASIVATFAQARKRIECWWIWIAVDVVSIPLYLSRDLWLTAVLYGIFLAICIDGLRVWRREVAHPAPHSP